MVLRCAPSVEGSETRKKQAHKKQHQAPGHVCVTCYFNVLTTRLKFVVSRPLPRAPKLACPISLQVNRRPRVNSPTYAHALPVRTSVGSSSSSTLPDSPTYAHAPPVRTSVGSSSSSTRPASHGTLEKTRGHLKPLASTVCPRHRVGGLVSFCADDTSTQFSTLAPTYRTVCARSLRAGSSGAEGLSRTAPLAVGACHVQRCGSTSFSLEVVTPARLAWPVGHSRRPRGHDGQQTHVSHRAHVSIINLGHLFPCLSVHHNLRK